MLSDGAKCGARAISRPLEALFPSDCDFLLDNYARWLAGRRYNPSTLVVARTLTHSHIHTQMGELKNSMPCLLLARLRSLFFQTCCHRRRHADGAALY